VPTRLPLIRETPREPGNSELNQDLLSGAVVFIAPQPARSAGIVPLKVNLLLGMTSGNRRGRDE
jgi:hypothetical protein